MEKLKAAVLVSENASEQVKRTLQWWKRNTQADEAGALSEVDCVFIFAEKPEQFKSLSLQARNEYPVAVRVLVLDSSSHVNVDQVAAHIAVTAFDDDHLRYIEASLDRINALDVPSDMRRWLCQMETVPVIKGVYLSLIKALKSDEPDLDMIIDCIGKDQFLLMKLLQSANSCQFSNAKSVYDIRQAVMRIGLERLYYLVIVVGVFSSTSDLDEYKRSAALSTAFDVAFWSQRIAIEMGVSRADCDSAYLAGLLHNLGQTLVHEKELASLSLDAAFQLSTCESQAGAFWLALWGMPSVVVEAVAHQFSNQLSFETNPVTSAISVGRSVESFRVSGMPMMSSLEQYQCEHEEEEQKLHKALEALEANAF
jgi:HD-like signal output (HDOD) protein